MFLPAAVAADDPEPFLPPGSPVSLPFGLTAGTTLLAEIAAVVVTTVLWLLLYAAVLAWTRPKPGAALPANADLPGEEPPAVVSLLAGGWSLNEDAVESTLLDLAARHYLELRQPGNDPLETTVHVLPAPAGALTPYEQQVLDHVRSVAVNDVVPLTALTFRDRGRAESWTKLLHERVVADARGRGLSRRRISPPLAGALGVLAVIPAGLLALTVIDRSHDGGAWGVGLFAWAAFSALAGRPLGERDTPAGREAAARWLGLKAFLKNDEAFADLPPAAVTVWDRYLSYGDALGVTRVAAAVLDLGMGDRKRVWSSFGGQWHPVRVRYPKFWGRYGLKPPRLIGFGVLCLVAGGWVLKTFGTEVSGIPALIGTLLVVRGLYRITRTALDLAAPRTVTGEVLWVERWRSTQEREDKPSVPLVDYLAVDDGSAERTTAWALPSEEAHRAHPGDEVTIVVRPWTRRVTDLEVTKSRRTPLVPAPAAPTPTPTPAPAPAATGPAGSGRGAPLLGASDVAAALGRPVTADGSAAQVTLGPFELVTFSAADDPAVPLLVLAVARGRAVNLVVRGLRNQGRPLAGVPAGEADEALGGRGWVAARRGDVLVRVSSDNPDTTALPGLLSTALARLPAHRPSTSAQLSP